METIGKYKLVRVIGEGGMGRVYEAIDPMIGRRVAIKTISINIVADADTRARFFREAQAAGQLSHPNLITIHDIGEAEGTPYIVMEYLEGMDLNRKIRQGRLSFETKMKIMMDVCDGLAFAHGHDIIHRDIKPANIFVTTVGRVKILDFGLARGALSDVTQTGKILGTPNYMAPEQIRGDDIDHRADIFAAGVVFYELISGRKAFEGDSIATTLYKILETHPPRVHVLDEQLPAALSDVIERAIAKDRLARFQTTSDLLEALVQAHGRTTPLELTRLQMAASHTPPPVTATLVRGRASAMMAMTGWIVAGLAVASIAGFALWSRHSRDTQSSHPITHADPASRHIPPLETLPRAPAPPAPPADSTAATSASPSAFSPATGAAPSRAGDSKVAKSTPPPHVVADRPASAPSKPSRAEAPAFAPPPNTPIVPAAPPPAVVPPASPEPKATPIEPPPVAPAVSSPPPPPVVTQTARADESPATAVQAVLMRYRAALESRDIGALKRVWPALGGRQEDAIRNEFEHARAIVVGFDGVDVRPTSGGATVTCRRTYAVTTTDGQTLKTATTMFLTLARRDGAWSIETIRHEGAR
jgi:serine/threonine protein kinase